MFRLWWLLEIISSALAFGAVVGGVEKYYYRHGLPILFFIIVVILFSVLIYLLLVYSLLRKVEVFRYKQSISLRFIRSINREERVTTILFSNQTAIDTKGKNGTWKESEKDVKTVYLINDDTPLIIYPTGEFLYGEIRGSGKVSKK